MTKWALSVVLCDLVLAVVINSSATLLGGAPLLWESWYMGTASAFFTNMLIQLVLPVPLWGRLVGGLFPAGTPRWLAGVFTENFVFVTCISFTMALLQHGSAPLIGTWLSTYPQLVLIGYVTSLLLSLACDAAARRREQPAS